MKMDKKEINRMKNLFMYQRGVVISEQKNLIKEDFDYNKYPCISQSWTKTYTVTSSSASGQKEQYQVQGQGNDFIQLNNNLTYALKDISFMEDGDWYAGGFKRGTFSCNGSQILLDGKTLTTPKSSPAAQLGSKVGTILATVTIPELLKDAVGSKTGVQAFQDWLDQKYPGWLKKYGTLNSDPKKGYGKYGPSTTKAFGLHKEEYSDFLKNGQNDDFETVDDSQKNLSTTDDDDNDPNQINPTTTNNTVTNDEFETSVEDKNPQQTETPLETTAKTGEQLYTELYNKNYFKGEGVKGQDERVKYVGPPLTQEQETLINQYFQQLGYTPKRERLRNNGKKIYVWKK